jgi:hypothetical protein
VRAARAMSLATRVACNKEVDGNSNKGTGNRGGGQAMARRTIATMWAMATAMRLVGEKKGKGKGGKGNGDGNVRVAIKEEGKVSKGMALATRMVGEWTVMVTKRVMVIAMRVVGKQRKWR